MNLIVPTTQITAEMAQFEEALTATAHPIEKFIQNTMNIAVYVEQCETYCDMWRI